MVPKVSVTTQNIQTVEIPTNTYRVLIEENRMKGETDGLEAMKQAVYLLLSTERYEFPVYSWNYGIELKDLFGQQMTYVQAVLEYRIKDALSVDDRITEVKDFEFEVDRNNLTVNFVVATNQGEIESTVEVTV